MSIQIRVLLVEDSEDDAHLVIRALRQGGFDPTVLRVQDANALSAALKQQWDVVLSDFSMPGFCGLDALALCRSLRLDVPFILLSGTVGEESAVAVMKAGANDYVMKHNLARLAPALLREIQDAAARASLRRTEVQLIESEKRFHAFMDASPFVASIKDHEGRYVYMNQGWDKIFGAPGHEWIGRRDGPLQQMVTTQADATDIDVLAGSSAVDTISELQQPGGVVSHWKNTRFPFFGASGQRLLGEFSTDVTALRASEETIRKLAFLDPLTGLPNRRMMQERLTRALALSMRSQCHGALLFLDLDNFKALNDTHGHDAGDAILCKTGERLRACVRQQDTVSRNGGDEFVIILEKLSCLASEATDEVDAIGRKIASMINIPYVLDGVEFNISASVGMTLFCDHSHAPDELMKHADVALYSAKASGDNVQMIFNPAMQARMVMRKALEADLRRGLENGHFVLFYQPQVDDAGKVTGVEALIRLHHPEKGLVMPATFIRLAEETGLIIDLGYWTIKTACTQLHAWSGDSTREPLTISVNVSARQFSDPAFLPRVLGILGHSGANPNRLILELTESLLLDEVDQTIGKMIVLRQHGIRFSLVAVVSEAPAVA